MITVFFAVHYVHRDLEGWQEHLPAHVTWLRQQVAAATNRASGDVDSPVPTERRALLIMSAPDRATLDEILAADPFAQQGQVSESSIEVWNPVFGTFAEEADPPPGLDEFGDRTS